jgi:hypothetical protein
MPRLQLAAKHIGVKPKNAKSSNYFTPHKTATPSYISASVVMPLPSAAELAVIDAVYALNRALYRHEQRIQGYGVTPINEPHFDNPPLLLLIYTKRELRAMRDAITRYPLAALRLRADLEQVRKRWARNLSRAIRRGAR